MLYTVESLSKADTIGAKKLSVLLRFSFYRKRFSRINSLGAEAFVCCRLYNMSTLFLNIPKCKIQTVMNLISILELILFIVIYLNVIMNTGAIQDFSVELSSPYFSCPASISIPVDVTAQSCSKFYYSSLCLDLCLARAFLSAQSDMFFQANFVLLFSIVLCQ